MTSWEWVVCVIASSKKPMRVSSSAAVRSKAGRVSSSVPGSRPGSRTLQWIACGLAGELGTDLAHAVAEADHVVKAPAGELAEVLGTATREIDPALSHHPHRVGMQRLGMAAGAGRAHHTGGQLLGQCLGHLGARAIARAEKQRALVPSRGPGRGVSQRPTPAPVSEAPALTSNSPQRGSSRHVVGVTAVGEAAAGETTPPSRSWRRWYETRLWRCPASSHSSPTRRSLRASSLSSRQRRGWPASRRKPRRWGRVGWGRGDHDAGQYIKLI